MFNTSLQGNNMQTYWLLGKDNYEKALPDFLQLILEDLRISKEYPMRSDDFQFLSNVQFSEYVTQSTEVVDLSTGQTKQNSKQALR